MINIDQHRTDLLRLYPADLGAALSRLSLLTDGIIYWSKDFPGAGEDTALHTALLGLAARGAEALEAGTEIEITFTGLHSKTDSHGNWTITASFRDAEGSDFTAKPASNSETTLGALDAGHLRRDLSEMINFLPRTAIIDSGFGSNKVDKTLENGETLDIFQQMLMLVCSALHSEIPPGETRAIVYDIFFKGETRARRWQVEATHDAA